MRTRTGPGEPRALMVQVAALAALTAMAGPAAGQDEVVLAPVPEPTLWIGDRMVARNVVPSPTGEGTLHYLELPPGASALRVAFELPADPDPAEAEILNYFGSDGIRVRPLSTPGSPTAVAMIDLLGPGAIDFHLGLDLGEGDPEVYRFYAARLPYDPSSVACLRYREEVASIPGLREATLQPSGRPIDLGRPIEDWPLIGADTHVLLSTRDPFHRDGEWRSALRACLWGTGVASLRSGGEAVDRLFVGESDTFTFVAEAGTGGLASGARPIRSIDEREVGILTPLARGENRVHIAIRPDAEGTDRLTVGGLRQEYELAAVLREAPVVDSVVYRHSETGVQTLRSGPAEVWRGDTFEVALMGRGLSGFRADWSSGFEIPREDFRSDSLWRFHVRVPDAARIDGRAFFQVARTRHALAEARVVHDPRPVPYFVALDQEAPLSCAGLSPSADGRARFDDDVETAAILVCPRDPSRPRGPQYLSLTATLTAPGLEKPVVQTRKIGFPGTAPTWPRTEFVVDSVWTPGEILDRNVIHLEREGAVVTLQLTHAAEHHRGTALRPDSLAVTNDGWGYAVAFGAIPDFVHVFKENDASAPSLGSLEIEIGSYDNGREGPVKLRLGAAYLNDLQSLERFGPFVGLSWRPSIPGLEETVLELGVGVTNRGEAMLMVGPSFGKVGKVK